MENQNPPFPPPPPGNPYMQNPMGNNPMGMQQDLPNAVGVLVLGICSIALCWCYGIIGIACGVIALVLASKSSRMYNDNPSLYTQKSYNNLKAGRVCAIIGTCISILWAIYMVVILLFMGGMYNMPWNRF